MPTGLKCGSWQAQFSAFLLLACATRWLKMSLSSFKPFARKAFVLEACRLYSLSSFCALLGKHSLPLVTLPARAYLGSCTQDLSPRFGALVQKSIQTYAEKSQLPVCGLRLRDCSCLWVRFTLSESQP